MFNWIEVKELREVVIPGDVLGEAKPGKLPYGVFKEGDQLYSALYGLIEPEKGLRITPLSGRYIPKPGDVVIGIVIIARHSGYLVDINSPYVGHLVIPKHASVRPPRLSAGDVVTVKVASKNEVGDVLLESPRRLIKGKLIEVKPTKIPRIFGKSGSMLELIKNATKVQIIVGRNGRIWLRGEPDAIVRAERAIRFIEKNAHMYGVTDAVKKMLEGDQ